MDSSDYQVVINKNLLKSDIFDSKNILRIKDTLFEVDDWCERHCQEPWIPFGNVYFFKSNNDAILFKLTWG